MGWAHGTNAAGRDIGYGVRATCDRDGCETVIDRGISYACGGEHDGGDNGCGKYFCAVDLEMVFNAQDQTPGFLCATCSENWLDENPGCSCCDAEGVHVHNDGCEHICCPDGDDDGD